VATVLGFIGVGTIAAAIVRGLLRRRPELEFLLSPRSETVASSLASEDARVRRATSNAAVVEGSEIVVLAMRPPQLTEAVAGLPFRKDQVVVSCLANTSLDEVAGLVAPASVCRMIPLPMIERGAGPLVLYPAMPDVRGLFEAQGELIVAASEAEFRAYSAASGAMSTFFALQAATICWLEGQGAPAVRAEAYVRAMQLALAETGAAHQGGLDELVAEHETQGGINERVRRTLGDAGWFDAVGRALDGLGRISGGDLNAGGPASSKITPSRRPKR
jgi:pyrroline-5-carboxylate reductase